MSNNYYPGSLVRLSASFTSGGVAADPTTVALKYRNPVGTILSKSYALAEVVKDSTGHYHYDLSVTTHGVWAYRWESTGAAQAASEADFTVLAGAF